MKHKRDLALLALIATCWVAAHGAVWAMDVADARPEEPVYRVVQTEADHFREVKEMVQEDQAAGECPLVVSSFYDVPLTIDLQAHIINECGAYGIDPAVVLSMIQSESSFRVEAVGDGGESFGLMQVQPKWHQDRMERLGVSDLLNPYQNVQVGIDFLAEQLDRYDGDLGKALTAYNRGHYDGEVSKYALTVMANSETLAEGVIANELLLQ